MSNYFQEGENTAPQREKIELTKIQQITAYYNAIKDKIQIYVYERWSILAVLIFIFIIRLFITGGYFALTYCMGIHFLNYFIGFLTPLEDPEETGDDSFLPQKNSEEFRPFQRKVKEFTFWENAFWTLIIGNILTFIQAIDIPVFWPLLLFYFLLIFTLTMRKQIKHMIKYKYVPWDFGKASYKPRK